MARQVVTDEFAEAGDDRSGSLPRSGLLVLGAASRQRRKVFVDLAAMLVGVSLSVWLLGRLDMICASLWWIAVVVVIRSDLERFIIPDEASAAIAVLGLVYAVAVPIRDGWPAHTAWDAGASAMLGGILAFAVFLLVARIYRYGTGREGLGFGDVKLAGACAIWLGPRDQVIALEIAALAAIAGVLVFRRGREARGAVIPFGAFLAPSAWLVFVAGPVLNKVVERYA